MKPYEVICATRGSALTPTQRHVLTHVVMRAGADGACFASVATLEEDTGFGARTIQGALKELVALGVLEARTASGRSTTYTVKGDAVPRPAPNHRRSRTTATSAPPQEVRPTPADSADLPPQEVRPTPADSADDQYQDSSLTLVPGKNTAAPPAPLVLLPGVGQQLEDPPTVLDPTPSWARGHKGVPSVEVLGAVVHALEQLRQRPVRPDACQTDARCVLSLWKARGRPPIREFADELALVARWARESDDPAAENDIRGTRRDGTVWGADRSRAVATLTRHDVFGDRLDAATRWESGTDPPTFVRGAHPGSKGRRPTAQEQEEAYQFWLAEEARQKESAK